MTFEIDHQRSLLIHRDSEVRLRQGSEKTLPWTNGTGLCLLQVKLVYSVPSTGEQLCDTKVMQKKVASSENLGNIFQYQAQRQFLRRSRVLELHCHPEGKMQNIPPLTAIRQTSNLLLSLVWLQGCICQKLMRFHSRPSFAQTTSTLVPLYL